MDAAAHAPQLQYFASEIKSESAPSESILSANELSSRYSHVRYSLWRGISRMPSGSTEILMSVAGSRAYE